MKHTGPVFFGHPVEYGGQIEVLYSDFEKAFDKVPHIRLISKLYSYGISETIGAVSGSRVLYPNFLLDS